jgi:hypothetical protein
MSQEPVTKHFSPAELAVFLDQLGDGGTRDESRAPEPSRRADALHRKHTPAAAPRAALAPVDPRFAQAAQAPALAEPATVLGGALTGGEVIPIGAPRWRGRPPQSAPPARAAAPRAKTSHARLRDPASFEPGSGAALVIPGLTRARPWRVAFVIAALLSAGLLAALWLRPGSARSPGAREHKPPPLPPQPVSSPLVSVARALPAQASAPAGAVRPQAAPPSASVARVAARREAVDLLLAGRTRAALDAYRALAAAAPSADFSLVVRLLERELRSCSAVAGSPCGS